MGGADRPARAGPSAAAGPRRQARASSPIAILDLAGNDADLRERVTILSGIEDVELQALYRDCLFTIYPSLYEGWGLPVTESLCYGKVPLDCGQFLSSGGRRRGGALFQDRLNRGDDRGARTVDPGGWVPRAAGKRHPREFRPRGWAEIADGVAERIGQWAAAPAAEWQAPLGRPHTYYPLTRIRSTQVWPGMGSAELFRHGLGWHRVEDTGCWTRPSGGELALRLSNPDVRRLGFEIFCPQRNEVALPG